MFWRLAFVGCVAGGAALCLVSCSGDRQSASSSGSSDGPGASPSGGAGGSGECPYSCAQPSVTGPHITVAPAGVAIAAIETIAPCTTAPTPCSVGWSGWLAAGGSGQSTPITPAPIVDAGWATDVCGRRYECAPDGVGSRDGGAICTQAWVNLSAEHCLVTVISPAGERQSFEVTVQTDLCTSYRCRTGMGECVSMGGCEVVPSAITATFDSPG